MKSISRRSFLALSALAAPALSLVPSVATADEALWEEFQMDPLSTEMGISTMSGDPEDTRISWTKTEDGSLQGKRSDGTTWATISGATGLGIDVSQWQGTIDWQKVKLSGIVDFAIIRCGWGKNSSRQDDSKFLENVRGCLDNNIPFGIYLYSYAHNVNSAQDELAHVMRQIEEANLSPADISYPVYLDLEELDPSSQMPAGVDENNAHVRLSNSELEQIAKTFCNGLIERGYRPGIYASYWWWTSFLVGDSFSGWERWVAQYYTSCAYKDSYNIWQCMSNGLIDGIDTNVDVNISYGNNMHRLYNPWTGEHFYTANITERDYLVSVDWQYERVAWSAPTSGTPVYRLFNSYVKGGDHHYTTNAAERDHLIAVGWTYEGVGWYSGGSVPLYRLYNPYAKTGTHHYTSDANERDTLKRLGWRDEGVGWYGLG